MERIFGDRYEVEGRIGAGGMAEVWRGHDRVLNRTVAIKTLLPQFARDASFVDRFRREAQAAARLNHHGIVSVYDSGTDGETPYIVMQFIEGRTLADYLASGKTIPPMKAAQVAKEIAEALAAAHARGRDPPGHQAGERHGHARRQGAGDGLRHRAADQRSRDRAANLRRPRHRFLPFARASAGPVGGRPDRHLRLGRRPVRDADRAAAVHRRLPDGDRLQAGERHAPKPRRRPTPTCRPSWTPL